MFGYRIIRTSKIAKVYQVGGSFPLDYIKVHWYGKINGTRGLKQGCVLSPMLFIPTLEKIANTSGGAISY